MANHIQRVLTRCPTCDQPIPNPMVRVSPATYTVLRDGEGAVLPRLKFLLFNALWEVYPAGLSKHKLMNILYADDPDGGPKDAVIGQMAHQARLLLAPLHMSVEAQGGSGSEYRLIISNLDNTPIIAATRKEITG